MRGVAGEPPDDDVVRGRFRSGGVGFKSAFQSLGLNHRKYNDLIAFCGAAFSIIIPLLFASMPVTMYLGWVK